MTEISEAPAPVLLWKGQAAMFASPDGGRIIWYDQDGEDRHVAIPAELVPALEMLRANPAALLNISNSPLGGMARRFVRKATEAAANGNV